MGRERKRDGPVVPGVQTTLGKKVTSPYSELCKDKRNHKFGETQDSLGERPDQTLRETGTEDFPPLQSA
eukprot:12904668-Prorocentrum_lima.AAC.1